MMIMSKRKEREHGYRKASTALIKKILLGFEHEHMAVHAPVYNKNIHDEGKATRGLSQRNQ